LMQRITRAAQRARLDTSTMSFLRSQVNTVKKEYRTPTPNQHVVSAAIGATLLMAERLGASVVQPELVRELAALAPMGARG
jgi:hypothetical protein